MFNLLMHKKTSTLKEVKVTLLREIICGLNNWTQDISTHIATYNTDSGRSMNFLKNIVNVSV
jgi:hypothetical protein